jgi:capsid protein
MGVFSLKKGEELRPFTNSAPVAGFSEFMTAIASNLAASLSMPLEVVLMRFNQNYSASRAALVLYWRVVAVWREEMASDLLNVVYENWLAGEIASGRVAAPGWSDARLRAAWLKNQWIGAPMPNIDPTKTAAADQVYAEMGAQTLDRIALNFNGSSGKANRAKLAREYASLPLPPWSKAAVAPPTEKDGDGE